MLAQNRAISYAKITTQIFLQLYVFLSLSLSTFLQFLILFFCIFFVAFFICLFNVNAFHSYEMMRRFEKKNCIFSVLHKFHSAGCGILNI